MPDLDEAVQSRIARFTPGTAPALSSLRARRRRTIRLRWAVTSITTAAGLFIAATVLVPGPRHHRATLVDVPTSTLAAQFDGYVASSASQWDWTSKPPRIPEALPTLVRGPKECAAAKTLWLLMPLNRGKFAVTAPGFIRDPGNTTGNVSALTLPYLAHARLPADARTFGWTVGYAELWFRTADPNDAYLVNTANHKDVERWPALKGLCA